MSSLFFKQSYDNELLIKGNIDNLTKYPINWFVLVIGVFFFILKKLNLEFIRNLNEIDIKATISGGLVSILICLLLYAFYLFFKMFHVLNAQEYLILDLNQVSSLHNKNRKHYIDSHKEGNEENEDILDELEVEASHFSQLILNEQLEDSYCAYSIQNQNINEERLERYYELRKIFVINIIILFLLALFNIQLVINGQ